MTEIRERKKTKEVAGQCNRPEELLSDRSESTSNQSYETGETLDQSNATGEMSNQSNQAGETVKRRRTSPALFSLFGSQIWPEECEGDGASRTSPSSEYWNWQMDLDTAPKDADVAGVESSFDGLLGMSGSEGCALEGHS